MKKSVDKVTQVPVVVVHQKHKEKKKKSKEKRKRKKSIQKPNQKLFFSSTLIKLFPEM